MKRRHQLMAHIDDQPLNHRKCRSNITLIWNNGHNAAAHEYEYAYVRRCDIHTCHHNRLLFSASLAPLLRSPGSRTGMQGQKASSGANPLVDGEENFLSASQQR